MKKAITLLLLFICACDSEPPKNPFALYQSEVSNTEAFKEASKYIIQHWSYYSKGGRDWNEIQSHLIQKGLKLKKFNEFHLSRDNGDTSISFDNHNDYILAGDTVFKHIVIYKRSAQKEVIPTLENRMLIKRIDTNLYYMVLVDRCPGCMLGQ